MFYRTSNSNRYSLLENTPLLVDLCEIIAKDVIYHCNLYDCNLLIQCYA